MSKVNKSVASFVSKIKRNNCKNNTQKVFLSLLKASSSDGWVSRTSLQIPSVTARIRDLRKSKFGGFRVACSTAKALNRRTRTAVVRPTYYRLDPRSVTVSSLKTIFEGVI